MEQEIDARREAIFYIPLDNRDEKPYKNVLCDKTKGFLEEEEKKSQCYHRVHISNDGFGKPMWTLAGGVRKTRQ